ncbi:MAG TPA: cytochrome d ubiquinol oxidase subunit II [Burkholderiales bacterium]|nr:cytochrome d ubiquinol oxidase subunit II [Burkholderiales bacterium]
MTIDLPLAFTLLMGLAILLYVLLDGYDLGVGMLIAGAERDEHDVMVASIGPFWDANETWLVLGIGVLLTAFPVAHGLILGELYLPVAAMLVGLMFRGVAFELRLKARGWQRELWNWLFWAGSFLAAFSQGLMLGRYVTGFAPGFGEWLFALLVGASLCGGYVLLGATWLVLKTEGALQKKALAWSRWGLAWVALGVALVSLATPLASETVREKWFTLPRFLVLSPLPLATLGCGILLWRSLGKSDWKPFAYAAAIFALAFAGLAYSLFPYVVLDRLTIWQAAAPAKGLAFVLAGALVTLPFILGWTIYVYRVFRGKARPEAYED